MLRLYLDEDVVAQTEIDDLEKPSNLALFYRGKIASKTNVRVEISSKGSEKFFFIDPKYL